MTTVQLSYKTHRLNEAKAYPEVTVDDWYLESFENQGQSKEY